MPPSAERSVHGTRDPLHTAIRSIVSVNTVHVKHTVAARMAELGLAGRAPTDDLFSRRMLRYAISAHHDAAPVMASLRMAAATRGGDVDGVILHSDRGSGNVSGVGQGRSGITPRLHDSRGLTAWPGHTLARPITFRSKQLGRCQLEGVSNPDQRRDLLSFSDRRIAVRRLCSTR